MNPATAHLKSEKARALKKSKATISAQRQERLASRNPLRLERQISELKEGGLKNARDKKQLGELERQLSQVKKARAKAGDKAHTFGEGGRVGREGDKERPRSGVLGKRTRGEGHMREQSSGSETDESVRRIPMPRDTPPPIPSQYRHVRRREGDVGKGNANMEPLGEGRQPPVHEPPPKPEAKTTYEAKPAVRDLRKEAVKAFIPAVVARKVGAVKGGSGRLLEEDEVQRLEREGYTASGGGGGGGIGTGRAPGEGTPGTRGEAGGTVVGAPPRVDEGRGGRVRELEAERIRLVEEEARFSREVRMEEISDEDL